MIDDLMFPMDDFVVSRPGTPTPPCYSHPIEPSAAWQRRLGWDDLYEKCPSPTGGRLGKAHLLGRNSSASVKYAEHRHTGAPVAIKKFAASPWPYRAKSEFEAGRKINSPFFPRPRQFGHDVHTGKCYIVMQYMPGSTLETWRTMPAQTRLQLCADVLAALDAIHKAGFAHNDIALRNIIEHKGRACLVDMGESLPVNLEARLRDVSRLCLTLRLPSLGRADASHDSLKRLGEWVKVANDSVPMGQLSSAAHAKGFFAGCHRGPPAFDAGPDRPRGPQGAPQRQHGQRSVSP